MAQLQYVVANKLHDQAKEKDASARAVMATIGVVVSILTGLAATVQAAFVVGGVFFVLTLFARSSDARFRTGAEGEDLALAIFKQLPDTYTVFNQLDVPNARSRTGVSEADLVICGPNAVVVIEVKANNGKIICDERSATWTVSKVGRRGTGYEKTMRNPVAQCKNLVWCLGEHLKAAGAKPWIQGLVLFTHPEVRLVREGQPSIPVLLPRDVLAYIQSFERRSTPELLKRATAEIVKLRGVSGVEGPAQDQTPPVLAAAIENGPRRRAEPRL